MLLGAAGSEAGQGSGARGLEMVKFPWGARWHPDSGRYRILICESL